MTNESEIDRIVDDWIAGKTEGVPALAPAMPSAPSTISAVTEQPKHPLTKTLLEPVIRLPFDYLSIGTDYEPWALMDKEAEDLTEIWLPVLQRLLPASKSIDIIIAATCTIGIIGVKFVRYKKDTRLASKQEREERKERPESKPIPMERGIDRGNGGLPRQIDRLA